MKKAKRLFEIVYSIVSAFLLFPLLVTFYMIDKIDLNKSLNYFGLGTSDSDTKPLNQDVKLKYEEQKWPQCT